MTGLENKLRAALRDTADEIPATPPPLRLPPGRDSARSGPVLARPAPLDQLGRPAGRRGPGPRGGRRLTGRGPRRVRADDERACRPGRRPAVLRRPDGARLSRRVRRERHGRRDPGHSHRRGAGEGRPAQAVRPLRRRDRGGRSTARSSWSRRRRATLRSSEARRGSSPVLPAVAFLPPALRPGYGPRVIAGPAGRVHPGQRGGARHGPVAGRHLAGRRHRPRDSPAPGWSCSTWPPGPNGRGASRPAPSATPAAAGSATAAPTSTRCPGPATVSTSRSSGLTAPGGRHTVRSGCST